MEYTFLDFHYDENFPPTVNSSLQYFTPTLADGFL